MARNFSGPRLADGADQQSAGAAAPGRKPVVAGVAVFDQVVGAGKKVGESVDLGQGLALLVPGASQLAAAADMRDRVHDAAVEQREADDREARIHRGLVRAVAVEQGGRRAVQRDVGAADDGERHRRFRRRPRPAALLDIAVRLVGTEDRVVQDRGALEQAQLAGGQVVVVDRLRGQHRGVGEPDGGSVVLGLARQRRPRGAARRSRYPCPAAGHRCSSRGITCTPVKPFAAERDDGMAGVRAHREEPDARLMWDDRPPLGVTCRVQRSLSEGEVLRADSCARSAADRRPARRRTRHLGGEAPRSAARPRGRRC